MQTSALLSTADMQTDVEGWVEEEEEEGGGVLSHIQMKMLAVG